MNAGVQAGLVQLGIAGILVVTWYTGAWQVILDELVAGVMGTRAPGGALGALGGSGGPMAPSPAVPGARDAGGAGYARIL